MRTFGVMLLLLVGCTAAEHDTVEPARVFACAADDGATVVEGYDAISSCALCRRVEDAYLARAAELGCGEPFPLDACPLGALDGCFADQADWHADFVGSSATCEILLARTATIDNWSGFECGGTFCYAPPYSPLDTCGNGETCGRGPCAGDGS